MARTVANPSEEASSTYLI